MYLFIYVLQGNSFPIFVYILSARFCYLTYRYLILYQGNKMNRMGWEYVNYPFVEQLGLLLLHVPLPPLYVQLLSDLVEPILCLRCVLILINLYYSKVSK